MRLNAKPAGLRVVPTQPAPLCSGEYECNWFGIHYRIVSPIRRHLTVELERCNSVVDIGAGDGTVLDDIASRLPQLRKLIGIAADSRSLVRSRARCELDGRLEFVHSNPWSWLRRSQERGVLVFSYDNLSALSEPALEHWFQELPALGIEALALVEAMSGGCSELPAVLRRNGWRVGHCETLAFCTTAWWHVFASRPAAPSLIGELP